ncbi:MAG TPA: sigma-54 dependent transcriptional regulator [Gemmatimonadaceae bacterium]|nr:sigma-54 dependent transcriptional regulator [Gemmatimonadaceae bacterium]
MKVLISLTDVEPAVRLNGELERAGVETEVVSPLDDVRGAIRREKPDVIVMTGALVDPQNVALVREMLWDGVAVVGLADVRDPEIDHRLHAIGYAEVFAKPIVPDEVSDAIRRLLDRRRLASLTGLIGQSEAIREVLVKVEQIAPVTSTVLIEGESGSGKELVARAIHRLGPRRNKPFIAVNVGALPDTLLESELFGHEKGAFTGAAERRIGRFELANTGTLFLDEIGDVPLATQVKLLRVLEEREIVRVGGVQNIPVDVRVVAATNNPLRGGVEEGRFRSDLYYRLNVLSIYLPPLRERREDIPILVRQFIGQLSKQHDRPFKGISPEALDMLVEYSWPGNVRELRNLVESMVVLAPGREIGPADIPRQIRDGGSARFLPVHVGPVVRERAGVEGRELEFILRSLVELKLQVEELRRQLGDERSAREALTRAASSALGTPISVTGGTFGGVPDAPALGAGRGSGWPAEVHPAAVFGGGGIEPRDQPAPAISVTIQPGMGMAAIERAAIEAALRETRGNRRKAAELLGIGERTLYRKLRDYQLLVDTSALD